MKKTIIILSLCLVSLMIGCGTQSQFSVVGTWVLTSMEQDGKITKGDELHTLYGGEIIYQFKKDNVFLLEMMGQTEEGTWSEKDGKIYVNYKEIETVLEIKDGKMILEQNGYVFTFEKKEKK